MEELERLTNCLADVEIDAKNLEGEKEFTDMTLQIKDDIQGVHDFVDMLLKDRLSTKQELFLMDVKNQNVNPALDISVKYFGFDWSEVRLKLICFSNLRVFTFFKVQI